MKILCIFLSLLGANAAAGTPSADRAFSIEVQGGQLLSREGDAVFSWGLGRSVRLSIERAPKAMDDNAFFQRTAADANRLRQKGRRIDEPRYIKGEIPFSLTGFGSTSFGYFNARGNTYSFLIKGMPREQAAELMGTLREIKPERAPAPAATADPLPTPPPTQTLLPPGAGSVSLLNGRLEFPKPSGWRFVEQNDGWTLIEGPDWSFALSSRIIEELPASEKETLQGAAAAYFARFELDFVQERGCQASPIDGGALVNDWKMLFKTYQCPGMTGQRRQVVGILLPADTDMLGWTGDYDRAETFAQFENWLNTGRRVESKREDSAAPSGAKTPALLLAAIGAGLGFCAMILLVIWRRRKNREHSE